MEVPDYLELAGATEHGDLGTPHFMGLHALQVPPLIAFTLSRERLSTDAGVRMT